MEELREDLVANLALRGPAPTVYFGHAAAALWHPLEEGTARIVAFADYLDVSLAFMMACGASFLDAVRLHTAAFVLSPSLRENHAALVVIRDDTQLAVRVVHQILDHLEIILDAEARREILKWLALEPASAHTLSAALELFCERYEIEIPPEFELSDEDRKCAIDVLIPMLSLATAEAPRPIVWSIDILQAPGSPDQRAPKVIDLTGPPRCIVYGPYFHLPQGKYEVSFLLNLSKDVASSRFWIEMHDDECRARALIRPAFLGAFRGRFYFEQRHPEIRLAIRLLTEESAIEGKLALSQVTFLRIGDVWLAKPATARVVETKAGKW